MIMTKELNFLHSNTSEVSIVYNMKQQEKVEFQYLKFVDFKDLQSWDPKKYHKKENDLSGQVLFGEILSKRDVKWVKIEKDLEYPILGVRTYGKGVYLNRVSKGQDLKMKKYQIVEENDLFWCKVDTKNGAFGIVESDLAGSFGSTNMNVAKIDIQKVLPEYLQLLFSLPRFQQYLDSFITGTTNRKYISFDRLLNEVYLPLPTLEIQKQLVDKYNINIYHAENCREKIDKLKAAIEDYLMHELGIEIIEKQKQDNGYKYLQFVEFKELERWDWWNTQSKWKSKKYPILGFKDVIISGPKYGSNSKAVKKVTDIRYIRITDINEDSSLNSEVVSSEKPEVQYILKENDFLIARSGNTVGKTFLYKEKLGKSMYAGYLVKYEFDLNKVIPEYVFYYTKCEAFKIWIESKQRKSGQPNINGNEYLSFPIPLPPLEVQEKIVAQIDKWKAEIKELKQTAESLEIEAKEGFEKAIFN
jgi:type I restriction enzyme, S subunit